MKFHTVVIIYNPNSTGASENNAKRCRDTLRPKMPAADIKVVPTKSAGHAEDIAAKYADDANTLIISSSGDGGYNEVINGVLRNQGTATVAVLPSGNANDHHSSVASGEFYDRIVTGKPTDIEAIQVDASVDGKPWQRFAHSYVGFGLTPGIGKVLTERRPNVLTEKWYVLRHALQLRSVPLIVDGQKKRFSNLICSTIPRMAKVIKLAQDASPHDGKMEVYKTYHVNLFGLLKLLITAALKGMSHQERTEKLELVTVRPTLVQMDGEVVRLDANSDVRITCRQGLLRTIV